MNQGMYRAGPTAGGLPLPRARLGPLTGAIAAVSVLAFVIPLFVLVVAGRHLAGAWLSFREGGVGMFFLLLLDVALPIATGIAGAVAVRGKRVSPGLFFGVAALPLFVSVFFAFLANRLVFGALAGEAVDPHVAMRIDAEGLSEALVLDIFGSAIACGCAIIGAVSAASVVASIDVDTATRSDPARPSAVLGAATLVSGAAWFVGTIVVTALRMRTVGALSIFAVFVVGTLVPLAVLAARAAPVLRTWHDPVEARRGESSLFVAGLCAIAATLAFERVLVSGVAAQVFGAVAGESVDPSQKARILMELVDARKWNTVAIALHAVLGTATFGLALAGAIGPSASPSPSGFRHPASPSSVIALSVAVFLLGSTFALSAARARTTDQIASRMKTSGATPADVTLPVMATATDGALDDVEPWGVSTLVLRADGSGKPATDSDLTSQCLGSRNVTLFADRAATVQQLVRRLPMESCRARIGIAATPKKDDALAARLGDLAVFASVDHVNIGITFDRSDFDLRSSSGYLTVTSVSNDAIEYEGHRVRLPLGADAPDLRASSYASIRFVLRASDTFAHVVGMIAGMKQRFGERIPRGPHLVEVTGMPPGRGADPALPVGLRLFTPTVSGRLAPELVMRTTTLHVGQLHACFQEGTRRDPTLHGAVTIRFIIDRTGAVPSATPDAATTLPDQEVVACVARQFRTFTFAPPEGGIAVVTYRMTFAPTN